MMERGWSCEVELRTHVGARLEQQDRACVYHHGGDLLAVVCDGMGGTACGAQASTLAMEHTRLLLDGLWACTPGEDTVQGLRTLLTELDARVRQELGTRRGGTTVVMVLLRQGQLYWASAGDSRLYIHRAGELVQATRDHNLHLRSQEQLRNGQIGLEQFQRASDRGEALISFLGLGGLPVYDLTKVPLQPMEGDLLLLTTDGLYKALTFEQLRQTLDREEDLSRKADSLMEQVLDRGRELVLDNTTYILIHIGKEGQSHG